MRAQRGASLLTVSIIGLLFAFVGCVSTAPGVRSSAPRNKRAVVVPDDVRTIGEALKIAPRGGIIEVRAGQYEESLSLRDNVTIIGNGPDSTIIRGGASGQPTLRATGVDRARIEGCALEYTGDEPNYVVWLVDSAIEMRDCTVSGGTLSGIMVTGTLAKPEFERVIVHDNAESGMVFADGARGAARGCTAYNNGMSGITIADARTAIEFCTLAGNRSAGIWVHDDATSSLIGNIAASNRVGITAQPGDRGRPGRPKLDSNLAYDNPEGNYVSIRPGRNDIEADPGFSDPKSGDFRLRPGSPALLEDGVARGAWPVSTGSRAAQARTEKRSARTIRVPDDVLVIQEALNHAQPGDTVRVAAGEYKESLQLREGVSLIGAGRERVTVSGGGGGKPVLLVKDCPTGSVEGINFVYAGSSDDYVCWIINSSVDLTQCAFRKGALAGIEIRGEDCEPKIRECLVQDNAESGIVALQGAGGVIEYCDVSHNGLNGIAVDGGSEPDVIHNSVVDNKGVGIWVRDGAAPRVENNLVVGNEWGISADAGTGGRENGAPQLSGNVAWENRTNYARVERSANDLEADPLLRHRQGRDYHVREGSPAIAANGKVAGAYGIAESGKVWNVPRDAVSIAAALSAAAPGDQIVAAPGHYRETLKLVSGVSLRGESPETTHIEGGDGAQPAVLARGVTGAVLEGFTISYTGKGKAYAVDLVNSELTMRDCVITGASFSGVQINGGSPKLEQLRIKDNVESGILIVGGASGVVERCTIANNSLNGISVDKNSTTLIARNTLVDNVSVGIWVRGGAKPRVEQNIISGSSWGISADSGEETSANNGAPVLSGNCLWGIQAVDFEMVQKSDTDIVADPQFVDYARGDYRLQPGSPAILPDGAPRGAWPVAK